MFFVFVWSWGWSGYFGVGYWFVGCVGGVWFVGVDCGVVGGIVMVVVCEFVYWYGVVDGVYCYWLCVCGVFVVGYVGWCVGDGCDLYGRGLVW